MLQFNRYNSSKAVSLLLFVTLGMNRLSAQIKPNGQVLLPTPTTTVLTKPTAYPSGVVVNYVRTKEAVAPFTNLTDFNAADNTQVKQATQYCDGLGRPIQTVVRQGSPTNTDIVSYNLYDEFGREAIKYLPYAATTSTSSDGKFQLDPFTAQEAFNANQYGGEQVFYNQTLFEASPLNRPLQSMAAGNSWAGSGKGVAISYEINDANEVKIWEINPSNNQPITAANYDAGQLYRTITADEHNKKVVEYKDKEGKVILKKVQVDANPTITSYTGWLCTYYVYDDFGLLRCVIPPKAVEWLALLVNNWTFPTYSAGGILDELCFQYTYDQRNRMSTKKVPGAGVVRMVYDQRDRLVMTQDANMLNNNNWLITVYENNLNRPKQTVLYNDANNQQYHATQAANSITYPAVPAGGWGTALLTETYYDDYSWLSLSPALTAFNATTLTNSQYYTSTFAEPKYAQPLTQNNTALGQVTGTKVRVLNSTDYLYTVSYYDDKGRVMQTQATQYGGGTISTTNQYDFSGKVLVSLSKHTRPNQPDMTITTVMSYDVSGKLLTLEKDINGQGLKTIASNTYNALGQLQRKELGQDMTEDKPVETMDYTYNIRGWLTGINRGFANPLYAEEAAAQQDRWFGMQLCYNYGFDKATNTSNTMLNGNISGQIWKSRSNGKQRAYGYDYDAANRLMKADFNSNNGTTIAPAWNIVDGYDFTVTMGDGVTPNSAYDANGNILAMKQMGYANGSSGIIDDLHYMYKENSNKLINVIDFNNNPTTKLGDFRTAASSNNSNIKSGITSIANYNSNISTIQGMNDYSYDENGNLKLDDNKEITSIEYNYLNLPERIGINNKGSIYYTYDATGNKLQKKVEDNTQPTTVTTITNYVNGFIYESKSNVNNNAEKLQFINHEEGRFRPSSNTIINANGQQVSTGVWVADYFIKDHLGNVRMTLTEETIITEKILATLENPRLQDETLYFERLVPTIKPEDFDEDDNNENVENVENTVGMGILIKVNAGDKIKTGVFAHYTPGENTNNTPPSENELANQLMMGINAGFANVIGKDGLAMISESTPYNLTAVTSFLSNQGSGTPNTEEISAHLNWVMFDNELGMINENSGFTKVVGENMAENKILLQAEEGEEIEVQQSGYLYIFVNARGGRPVSFDDLFVKRRKSALLEETHYYPFGLAMNGISSKANSTLHNKLGITSKEKQSEEFSDGSGLEQYDFGARFYDQQIGRWQIVDPLAEKYFSFSPYVFCANNPNKYIDPNGKEIWIIFDVKNDDGTTTQNRVQYKNGKLYGEDKKKYTGNNEYVLKVKSDLDQLSKDDKKVKTRIDELAKSKQVHSIMMPNSPNGENKNDPENRVNSANNEPTGSITQYNPDNEKTSSGDVRPPRVALAHELGGHSWDCDKGTANFDVTINGISMMEVNAVNFENIVRAAMNLPKRTKYGNKEIPQELLDDTHKQKK